MRRSLRSWLGLALSTILVAGGIVASPPTASAAPFTVLVFSKTAGFRHDPSRRASPRSSNSAPQNGFTVEATEDAAQFTDANLARFDAVDLAVHHRRRAQRRPAGRVRALHHAPAAATSACTPPPTPSTTGPGTADWSARTSPATRAEQQRSRSRSPTRCTRPPRALPRASGTAPTSGTTTAPTRARQRARAGHAGRDHLHRRRRMGGDHPISWCQNYDGGRAWYTGLGHTRRRYTEANFRHAPARRHPDARAGAVDADCGRHRHQQLPAGGRWPRAWPRPASRWASTVLPNRGVLHTSRDGVIRYTDADGNTKVAADAAGLQRTTRRVCRASRPTRTSPPTAGCTLYYAPPLSTPGGDAPADRHAGRSSRRARASTGWPGSPSAPTTRIDLASEVTILDVPTSRGMCCHVGGDMDFDAAGNLYLSTGDDTNPFDSAGFAPIDERAGRNPAFDAQRTAAQQQRPARQGAADQAERDRRLHHPGRQHVRPGHRADPPGGLRDGLPQPVPDERGQGHRHRLPR